MMGWQARLFQGQNSHQNSRPTFKSCTIFFFESASFLSILLSRASKYPAICGGETAQAASKIQQSAEKRQHKQWDRLCVLSIPLSRASKHISIWRRDSTSSGIGSAVCLLIARAVARVFALCSEATFEYGALNRPKNQIKEWRTSVKCEEAHGSCTGMEGQNQGNSPHPSNKIEGFPPQPTACLTFPKKL